MMTLCRACGVGAALVLTLTASGTSGEAAVFNPETFTLSNGMQVVVVTNRRAPVVSHHVWYKVGSADSPVGKSGLAHFLEHLMFKGTDTLAAGEFSKIVARNGGNENAFTGSDYTGYFQTIARDRLETVMRMEADRMTHLKLEPEEVRTERDVVLEERSMRVDNDPGSRLGELVNATQYLNHPYRLPVIGWRHEMASYTREDALAFYRTWYAPNNAVLIVAGDIDAAELRPLAEKYYGVIPARPVPERHRLVEPPQDAPREVDLADPRVHQPYLIRSWLAPSFTAGETVHAYPLEVLAQVLGGTSTSRLYRSLVIAQKVATSAGAYYQRHVPRSHHLPGLRQPAPGGQPGRPGGGGRRRARAPQERAGHRRRGPAGDRPDGRRGGLCPRQPGDRGAQLRRGARDRADGRRRRGLARADRGGDRPPRSTLPRPMCSTPGARSPAASAPRRSPRPRPSPSLARRRRRSARRTSTPARRTVMVSGRIGARTLEPLGRGRRVEPDAGCPGARPRSSGW